MDSIKDFLHQLIKRTLPPESKGWLESQFQKIKETDKPGPVYLAFSAAPMHVGKGELELTPEDIARANELRPGFNPQLWSVDQACRTLLLLQLPENKELVVKTVEILFGTADMNEQAALYASFAVLPFPEEFTRRAAEGIRTNMTVVFDAIALDNPYPADFLEDAPWNQMVLKAAFMDRPMYRIYGLQKRANADLAKIISDFAHERWAAGRVVSPEFWRPVGKFVDDVIMQDIKSLYADHDKLQHDAASLVCYESGHPQARALLEKRKDQAGRIETKDLSWDSLAKEWWNRKNQGDLN